MTSKPPRHIHRRCPVALDRKVPLRKRSIDRSIIAVTEHKGRQYVLHATKGYRSYRVTE